MADSGGVAAEPRQEEAAPTPKEPMPGGIGGRLTSFIERLERLEDERRDTADQIKDVLAEAKGEGFDVPTMRAVLRLRRQKPHERSEQEELLEVYKAALGMA